MTSLASPQRPHGAFSRSKPPLPPAACVTTAACATDDRSRRSVMQSSQTADPSIRLTRASMRPAMVVGLFMEPHYSGNRVCRQGSGNDHRELKKQCRSWHVSPRCGPHDNFLCQRDLLAASWLDRSGPPVDHPPSIPGGPSPNQNRRVTRRRSGHLVVQCSRADSPLFHLCSIVIRLRLEQSNENWNVSASSVTRRPC